MNFYFIEVFSMLILLFPAGQSSDSKSVKERIDYINSRNSSWTAQENPSVDEIMESATFSHKNIESSSNNLPVLHYRDLDVTSFPENFDTRDKWPKCRELMSRIRELGKCFDCSWASAAASVITDRVCIGSEKPKFYASTEDIVTCCERCNSIIGRPDAEVGRAFDTFTYWRYDGVVTGEEYTSKSRNLGCKPYSYANFKQGKNVPCTKKCTNPKYGVPYEIDKIKATYVYQIPLNETDMKREIFVNGPIVATFKLYEDLFHYKLGVYQYLSGQYVGLHYTKIFGWGVEENQPYWLAANSWGKDWGLLAGNFKIVRGQNHNFVNVSPSAGRITGLTPREYLVGVGESHLRRNNSYGIQCFLFVIFVVFVNKLQI